MKTFMFNNPFISGVHTWSENFEYLQCLKIFKAGLSKAAEAIVFIWVFVNILHCNLWLIFQCMSYHVLTPDVKGLNKTKNLYSEKV